MQTKPKYPTPPKMPSADEIAARFHELSDDTFIRARVVQRVLDISNTSFWRMAKRPGFPVPYRIGVAESRSDPRYRVGDLRRFMAGLKAEA